MSKAKELDEIYMRLWDVTTDMNPECVEISLDIIKRLKTLITTVKRVDIGPKVSNNGACKEVTF